MAKWYIILELMWIKGEMELTLPLLDLVVRERTGEGAKFGNQCSILRCYPPSSENSRCVWGLPCLGWLVRLDEPMMIFTDKMGPAVGNVLLMEVVMRQGIYSGSVCGTQGTPDRVWLKYNGATAKGNNSGKEQQSLDIYKVATEI